MDPCVSADVLVVLLGCLPSRLGQCLCCWSRAVVAVSGFAGRRFWKDPNDPNHLICYLPLVSQLSNCLKFMTFQKVCFEICSRMQVIE